jgi:hypothetical protein
MPTYSIKAPNGKTYTVDGPAGATDEQVRAEVMRQNPDVAAAAATPELLAAPAPLSFSIKKGGKLIPFEVPGGASDEDIRKAAAAAGGSKAYLASKVKRADGTETDNRPTSFLQGVGEGIGHGMDRLAKGADWLMQQAEFLPALTPESDAEIQKAHDQYGESIVAHGINSVGARLGFAPSIDTAIANRQQASETSPARGSGLGRFVGDTVAAAPTMILPGGPFVQGAAAGVVTGDSTTPGGLAKDAVIGGVAGKVGDSVVRDGARLLAPVATKMGKNVRLLIGEGVDRLTPGQIARDSADPVARRLAAFEDRAAGQPFVGDMIQADRSVAQDQLNRAFAKRALAPIGERLPDNVATGHESVAYVGNKLSDTYNAVLPRLNGTIDPAFQRRLAAITARAQLPPEMAPQVKQLMVETGRAFSQNPGANGTFSGRTLRDATDKLDKLAVSWGKSDDPYVSQLGGIASQFKQELLSMAARQNPADAAALRGLNKGWAMLVRLESAAKTAPGGIAAPGQFTTAVRTADRSVRKRAVGRGEALLQDLTDAASTVMPSRIGDSGSAGRIAQGHWSGLLSGAGQTVPYMLAKRDAYRGLNASPASQRLADLMRAGAPADGPDGRSVGQHGEHRG